MQPFPEISELHSLESIFSYVLDNAIDARKNKWNGSQPVMVIIRDNLKESLEQTVKQLSDQDYRIVCRSGYGGLWNLTPYAVILNRKYNWLFNSYSPRKGAYPGFMFAEDMTEVYVLYMVGAGSKTLRQIDKTVSDIRKSFPLPSFSTDSESIHFYTDKYHYKNCTVFFKRYNKDQLKESSIVSDLDELIKYHEAYGDYINDIVVSNLIG